MSDDGNLSEAIEVTRADESEKPKETQKEVDPILTDDAIERCERLVLSRANLIARMENASKRAAVDLLVAMAKLGRLPAEEIKAVLSVTRQFRAYFKDFDIKAKPRFRWYDNSILYSLGTMVGQSAVFFGAQTEETNIPSPHRLPRDIHFRVRELRIYPDKKDTERFKETYHDLEVVEYTEEKNLIKSHRIRDLWQISLPEPQHAKNRDDTASLRADLAFLPHARIAQTAYSDLMNKHIEVRLITPGTNVCDGMKFCVLYLGSVFADELVERTYLESF